MGEMTGGIKGGMKIKESFILGASGPLTGGMEGFLTKTTDYPTSPYDFLSVRYGDADTLLTTFQPFPRWE